MNSSAAKEITKTRKLTKVERRRLVLAEREKKRAAPPTPTPTSTPTFGSQELCTGIIYGWFWLVLLTPFTGLVLYLGSQVFGGTEFVGNLGKGALVGLFSSFMLLQYHPYMSISAVISLIAMCIFVYQEKSRAAVATWSIANALFGYGALLDKASWSEPAVALNELVSTPIATTIGFTIYAPLSPLFIVGLLIIGAIYAGLAPIIKAFLGKKE